jgi:hypothetical protein
VATNSSDPETKRSGLAGVRYEFASSEELQQLLLEVFQARDYRPPVLPQVALEIAALTKKANAS